MSVAMKNTKHQTPNTRNAPNLKRQNLRRGRMLSFGIAGAWCLGFEVSLVFGVWCLVFSPTMLNHTEFYV
jgi:hypothetical protein